MSETSAAPTFVSGTIGVSTRHGRSDPSQVTDPLACRFCGRSTPADCATYRPFASEPWRWFGPGRICVDCEAEIRAHGDLGEREALTAAMIGSVPPNLDELSTRVKFFEELGIRPPEQTTPYDLGTTDRWAHIDRDALVADAHAAAEAAEVDTSWRAHESGVGCAGCGGRFSTGWPRQVRAPSGQVMPVCVDCAAVMPERFGERRHQLAFTDRLAARAAGLTGPPFAGWSDQIKFGAYFVEHPGEAGTGVLFAWMGDDLDRLRAHAAQNWPGLLADPDARVEAVRAASEALGAAAAGSGSGLRL